MSTQTSYGLVVISFIHIYIDIDVKRLILKSSIIIKCMYISLYTYNFFYMFYMFTCVSDLTMHFDKLGQLIKYLLVTNDYLIDALTIFYLAFKIFQKRRHVSIQTEIRPCMISTGTQTDTIYPQDLPVDLDESLESLTSTNSAVSEWTPSDIDGNNNYLDHHDVPPSYCSRKFIVFEECLDQLLQFCTICGKKCDTRKNVVGTLLLVSRVCVCGEAFTWESQPFTGSMSTGNLVLSSAILISGCSISQTLTMFQHANISCFSERTYYNIKQHYFVPAVERVWKAHQDALFDVIRRQNEAVVVGGDARCCSPGHTAKYGSYSLMDLELGQILDVQLVQVQN